MAASKPTSSIDGLRALPILKIIQEFGPKTRLWPGLIIDVTEEQVAARDMIVELDVPGAGPIKMAGLPLKFTETPGAIRLPPPRLGQDTETVLRRIGYGSETIRDLAERGVIGLDAPYGPTSGGGR